MRNFPFDSSGISNMKIRQIVRATLLLATLGVALAGCSGSEERKAAYLEHGKQLFAQGNYVKAQLELKNALQIDPKIAEAHFLLGEIAEQKQDWRNAFGQYKAATDLKPDYHDAQVKLGRIYLLGGDDAQAMDIAEAILKANAADVDGRLLKALVFGKRNDTQSAIDLVKPIVTADAGNVEAVLTLATLYVRTQKETEAAHVLNAAVAADPKDARLYLALAQLKVKDDPVEAERLLKKVVELEPDNYAYRVSLSGFYIQQKRLDDAEKLLRDGAAAKPEDYSRVMLLADFLSQKRGPAEAEKALKEALQAKPDEDARSFGLAKFYIATRQADKAEAVYKDVLKRVSEGPTWVAANNALADLLVGKHDLSGANELIARVLKESPKDSGALLLRGRIAMINKDPEAAIADYRQILHDDPNSTPVLKLLAEAQLANNQPELASDNVDRVIEADPNDVSARIAKIRLLFATKDLAGALKACSDAQTLSPGNPVILDLKAQILIAQQDWKSAIEAANELQKIAPNQPTGHLHLGRIDLLQGKGDAAVGEFEKAVELAPDSPDLWAVLIRADLALQHTDKAVGRMQALIKKNAKHPFAHELLAELYETQKQDAKAEAEFHKAIDAVPAWSVPVVKLAEFYQKAGKIDKAAGVYRDAISRYENLGLIVKLAELYVANQRTNDALALYRDVLNRHPDADVVANNLASTLLADPKADAKAIDEAYSLAKRFESSDNPFYLDTLAWVLYRKDDFKAALPLLDKATKRADRVGVLQYHLGMTRYRLGDKAAAKLALEKATDSAAGQYQGLDEAKATLAKL